MHESDSESDKSNEEANDMNDDKFESIIKRIFIK